MAAVLDITGFIDDYTEYAVKEFIANSADEKTLRVNISSRGGDFFAALGCFNALRESRKRIVTAAQGQASSAAAIILLAGDEVHAAQNSVIMFHMPEVMPNAPANSDKLKAMLESMATFEEVLVTALCGKTKKKKEDVTAFVKESKFMTAEQAKEMGIIDKILPFRRRKITACAGMPAEITNFVNQQNSEVERMSLKSICEKFEITVADNATEDQLTDAITNHVATVVKAANEQKPKSKETPAEKPVEVEIVTNALPATLLGMVKRSRQTEIQGLVASGKITAAVGASLEVTFCDTDKISNAVTKEGDIVDSFDATIDALKKNEAVINVSGSTSGVQTLPKQLKDEDNLLLKDAESRSK